MAERSLSERPKTFDLGLTALSTSATVSREHAVGIADLLPLGRRAGDELVASLGAGAVDHRAALVPVVVDDAVPLAAGAREHGGVPRPGRGGAVGVVAVREPGAFGLEAGEAVRDEEGLPAFEVIAAHLIEDDQHRELHARPGTSGGWVGVGLSAKPSVAATTAIARTNAMGPRMMSSGGGGRRLRCSKATRVKEQRGEGERFVKEEVTPPLGADPGKRNARWRAPARPSPPSPAAVRGPFPPRRAATGR